MLENTNASSNLGDILSVAFRNPDCFNLRPYEKTLSVIAQNALDNWKPEKSAESSAKGSYQVIDFFSGCGGMSLGFAAVSSVHPFFEIIGGCDINPEASCSYTSNFKVPCTQTDIRLLAVEDEIEKILVKFDNYQRSKPLIVLGCPPCQGFTSHRKKMWDKIDDRNELLTVFAQVAIKLNPECIVLENVPEILSYRYRDYFRDFIKTLKSGGYRIQQNIYNAASFGVPQNRFRAIVIAMKKDFLLPEPSLNPSDYVTVRQAIGHLPKLSAGEKSPIDTMHQSVCHRLETLKTIMAVSKNGGNRPTGVGPRCLDRVKGFYDVYGRLSWDKPSITITQYSRNPASGRYVHPDQDRGLTMREAATLQSFPIGFAFCGSKGSVFKQIGEAVPPKMACAIASNVLVQLLSVPPSKLEKQEAPVSINKIKQARSHI